VLVLDIQGTQSLDHRDRGVAGYIRETALALERLHPDAVAAYSLNPDLPLPGGVEPLVASGKLRFSDEIPWADVETLHVMSPYELSVPLRRLVPAPFTGRLVVTLFDLISEVLADRYLEDPGLRRRYRARHELVRQADLVLAISEAAKRDAGEILGIDRARVEVVPLAPSARFVPSTDGGRERFVLYTGGTDHRKNVERLLEAWGRLPARVRDDHDLVIACSVKPLEKNHYEVMAERLGFRNRLRVTGWVPDDEMLRLTQRATLAIYPPLYEGYGLPVAEALACDTPAIASNTSSLPELLPTEALFDPYDVDDMATAIERALTDRTHRARLEKVAREAPRRTYDHVARETVAHLRSPSSRSESGRRGRRGRRRLAFVTPLPPIPGGVSDYSARLLEELHRAHGEDVTIDVFVDGPPHERAAMRTSLTAAPAGLTARPLASFDRVESIEGGYDRVVVSLGNSEFHTGGLALLARREGVTVLAHDVRLTNLHRFAQWQHPEAVGASFHRALHGMYDGLPEALGADGQLSTADADRWGVLMARAPIANSGRYLVTSTFALELARLDARPADRHKLAVLPFSVGAVPVQNPTPAEQRPGPALVASFGVVNELKSGQVVVDAFARIRTQVPDARLVFVGPVGEDDAHRLRSTGEGIELTGAVDDDEYRRWLDRAWVAIQLRMSTNGESSGAIGDCLTAGVPTVATAIGANRDLPDDAVVKVPTGATAAVLADVVIEVLGSSERRKQLGAGARAYAATHSFERAARALYDELFGSSV
jgi:glycosyltransferase involved in cell wall biosynthesis